MVLFCSLFVVLSTLETLNADSTNFMQDAKRSIPDAIFQSEPVLPADYFNINSATDSTPVTLRSQPIDPLSEEGYAHPKGAVVQYYPRPQNNYGNYGGYRPNPPPLGYSYNGYINRQARRYPVMMYTLVQCIPCQRAKHLLAVNYSDVPSHFLELVGDEDWQRQLQVDLLKVTRQATFPYVFVCGQFIGGSSDLFNLHHSGQLRQMLNNCNGRG